MTRLAAAWPRVARPAAQGASPEALARARATGLVMQGWVDVPGSIVNAVMVWAILWPFYPLWASSLWLLASVAAQVSRDRLRRRYRRASPDARTSPDWGRRLAINTFVAGCLWALIASLILRTANPADHALVVFTLGGMSAGAVVVGAADLRAVLAYLCPVILPAIAILLTRASRADVAMGVMLGAFGLVLAVTGRSINLSILRNLRLRISQDILADELAARDGAMSAAEAIAGIGTWRQEAQTGVVTWSNETFEIFGVDRASFHPSRDAARGRIHPDDLAAVDTMVVDAIASGAGRWHDHRLVMDDGAIKYVHARIDVDRDGAGRTVRLRGIVQDVTDQVLLANKLSFAHTILVSQLDASADGVLVVDPHYKIILSNKQFSEMWRISPEQLIGHNDESILLRVAAQIVQPDKFKQKVRYLYEHVDEDSHDEFDTVDGRRIERFTVSLRMPEGDHLGRAWFFTDVTEQRKAAALALRTARADVLTGLANRVVFVEAVDQAIIATRRGGAGFAVIYLDLDRFKDVNDTLGHATGDELLELVARRMRGATRESDTLARFGGDEFALVATNIASPTAVGLLVEKLLHALAEPFDIAGSRIQSGASAGIDVFGPGSDDAETLLSHADIALYRAKSEQRGSFRFFTEAMDAETRARVSLGGELRVAIDTGELFLVYQPQVVLETGRITGLEALVRWRHPTRGVLGPDLFIPLAEQVGLIGRLGHWVLWAACRQAKLWVDAGIAPMRMCVNLSAVQLKAAVTTEADIFAALRETGLPPERLELELTESGLMDIAFGHDNMLDRLHRAGVGFAIDDFGTGYSSLDYLRRFPSARIKIPQNFVRNLDTNPGDAAIVKATIGLARELGLQVIAEGVEGRSQFDILKAWGCAEIQGFYFARPLAAEEIAPLLFEGGPLRVRTAPDERETTKPPPSAVSEPAA